MWGEDKRRTMRKKRKTSTARPSLMADKEEKSRLFSLPNYAKQFLSKSSRICRQCNGM
jgi:hypothetical protein